MPAGIVERILKFNQGRRPDTLALKFAKMRKAAFAFLRGTCHLFYQDWSAPAALDRAPLSLVSGDLHLENFGAYLGENGLVCFGVNDFDEAVLAPASWDLARFAASLFVGLTAVGRPGAEADSLAQDFLEAYARGLAASGAPVMDAAAQPGLIGDLMRALPVRPAPGKADERIEQTASGPRIKAGHERLLPMGDAERVQVTRLVEASGPAGAPRVLDVARWVAGTSSLGLDRYAVLVATDGALPVGPLLEVKEVRGSCLAPFLHGPQPAWPSEAERVAAAQRRCQVAPPALLAPAGDENKSFIIRNLSRGGERLNLSDPGWTERRLEPVMRTMAQAVANGHLRGSALAGASGVGPLQAFGQETAWRTDLIHYARGCAAQCEADYKEYSVAYDRGELIIN